MLNDGCFKDFQELKSKQDESKSTEDAESRKAEAKSNGTKQHVKSKAFASKYKKVPILDDHPSKKEFKKIFCSDQ